jgi:hypothetical protein
MKNSIHPLQFSLFRIIIGIYLFLHFLFLFPFSTELFSNEGMIKSVNLNLTSGLFPINLLNRWDEPVFVKIILVILMLSSLSLILGFKRRWAAALLSYGWIALFNRNNLILTPGLGFVGWLLVVMIFIPEGEPYSLFKKKQTEWKLPAIVYAGAWLIMSVAYTLSGIDKLSSPSWVDGTGFHKLLSNPLIRDTALVDLFRVQTPVFHTGITYLILFAELLFFPLALFRFTRAIAWCVMVFIHFGIIALMNISDLSVAMLMIHVFTFDATWLKPLNLISNKINKSNVQLH